MDRFLSPSLVPLRKKRDSGPSNTLPGTENSGGLYRSGREHATTNIMNREPRQRHRSRDARTGTERSADILPFGQFMIAASTAGTNTHTSRAW